MTDLEKRVENYIDDRGNVIVLSSRKDVVDLIVDFAKAETTLLSQHIIDLQKDKENLTNKVRKLENQFGWHDLEKNPNDLPKYYTEVWCDYGEDYGKGFYHKDDGGWWIEGHMFCSTIDAWCELPTRN